MTLESVLYLRESGRIEHVFDVGPGAAVTARVRPTLGVDMSESMPEEWRPVVGFEGRYEVSDLGRVRSVDRFLIDTLGRHRNHRGRLLNCNSVDADGYLRVELGESGRRMKVHTMVMAALVGPRPEDEEIRHLNGVKTDNRLANLAYGTRSENQRDSISHGTHGNKSKTRCPQGHLYDMVMASGHRSCRACRSAHGRRYRQENREHLREYHRRWRLNQKGISQ